MIASEAGRIIERHIGNKALNSKEGSIKRAVIYDLY